MSQLVAKWDKSYHFTDEELAGLVDLQNEINAPIFNAEDMLHGPKETKPYSEYFAQTGSIDVANPAMSELEAFKRKADELEDTMTGLQESFTKLCHEHEEVKEKSVGMRKLWEGLLKQQSVFETFAARVESRLAVYTQYGKLGSDLVIHDYTVDLVKPEFQAAILQAVTNAHRILEKPEYKEAQVNLLRYRKLLGTVFENVRLLFGKRIAELNILCHEHDSPVQVEEINQRYQLVAGELHALLDALQEAMVVDNQLAPVLHDCLSKYLATRFALAKRGKSPIMEEIKEEFIMRELHGLIICEQLLFNDFFGTRPFLERHFAYFVEQLTLQMLEKHKPIQKDALLKATGTHPYSTLIQKVINTTLK